MKNLVNSFMQKNQRRRRHGLHKKCQQNYKTYIQRRTSPGFRKHIARLKICVSIRKRRTDGATNNRGRNRFPDRIRRTCDSNPRTWP